MVFNLFRIVILLISLLCIPAISTASAYKYRTFYIQNNLKGTITVGDVEHHCYNTNYQVNLPLQVASGRMGELKEAEQVDCSSGYIKFKITYIYRGKTYLYYYKWNFDRDYLDDDKYYDPNYGGMKLLHYSYNNSLWYDLTDNANDDPSVNQIMMITSAECATTDCSSNAQKFTENYSDVKYVDSYDRIAEYADTENPLVGQIYSPYFDEPNNYDLYFNEYRNDPMYATTIVVSYNSTADTGMLKPESVNLGDIKITDGYGVELEPDAQGYVTFKYHKAYEIHFSKTQAYCNAKWGKVTCPSSIARIKDDDELIFACAQISKNDSTCPWTMQHDSPEPLPTANVYL
ncbi:hypothetical protein L3V83_02480 [Thiotrichales bacterium 19X7-9]|nr:hypothetical protein [Thiotrichales bacterium 19X7-9]